MDPSHIPLGSWVYIDGYGLYKAEDTGSSVKGNSIDIYMENHREALEFGVRNASARVVPAYAAEISNRS